MGECFSGLVGSFPVGDITVCEWLPFLCDSFFLVGDVGDTALADVLRVLVPFVCSLFLPLSGL